MVVKKRLHFKLKRSRLTCYGGAFVYNFTFKATIKFLPAMGK